MSAALLALLLLSPPPPGALELLAARVAAEAGAARAEAPLAVSVTAPGHPGLQEAFTTLLLSRLDALGLAPQLLPEGDAEALARARGTRALLRVRLTLSGTLLAAGDVLSTWRNFFSGRAAVRPAEPAAVVFAEVAPDAVVRALASRPEAAALFLEPAPLARFAVRTAALAAGDLDGDGQPELAVLTEEAVEVYASDGRLLARRALLGLPLAAAPPREPFGTLCICDGLLYAFNARQAAGEVLALVAGALVPRAPLPRPVVGCGRALLEAGFLPGVARLAPAGPGWPARLEGPAAWGLSARAGASGPLWLFLLEDGTARARSGDGPWRTLPHVGAGAALLDAPREGAWRVAASSDLAAPAVDRLRLLAPEDGAEHGSVEVPGRILQVTAAALEAGGPEALVLGVWRPEGGAELRLVRGAR